MATTEGIHNVNSHVSAQSQDEPEIEIEGLPPQHHAGRVGYGPNYNPDPTMQEKITGLKEELKGKAKHDPELVRHGRDIRSGEEKRKKITGQDEPNPFQSAKDSDESPGSSSPSLNTDSTDANIQKGGESVEGGKNTDV